MFAKKKLYTQKSSVLGLKHRDDDDASVTTKHRGVDVGSVYRNNTKRVYIKVHLSVNNDTPSCKIQLNAIATFGRY